MSARAAQAPGAPLLLGIDTGGTFTDAVLLVDGAVPAADGVIATAKVPTTHHDLAVGVEMALRAVIGAGSQAGVDPAAIGLVSLSTTLATNALVEGQGDPACLVVAGFAAPETERLRRRLVGPAAHPDTGTTLVTVDGGHDALGHELLPVDVADIARVAAETADRVAAYAVATQFSVRNPSHELAIGAALAASSGRPVTCSHELSSQLDGPRRAQTALLNARLIGMISRLEHAVREALVRVGIAAPLMMVKGDGSLASAELLARRPIETILSGPAASVVGAQHLAREASDRSGRAIVVDIGGTTTDIAAIADGAPAINPDGAIVAGHHTMVRAIDMATIGIGGDSEVQVTADGLQLGPARAIPLSRLAAAEPAVVGALADQLRSPTAQGHGRFLLRLDVASPHLDDADRRTRHLLAALGAGPRLQMEVAATGRDRAVVERLRRTGTVRVAGFTPTDAAVILGWLDAQPGQRRAATLGAELLARRSDGRGRPFAESAEAMASRVIEQLTVHSARHVVAAALRADGLQPDAAQGLGPPDVGQADGARQLLAAGVEHHRGFLSIDVEVAATVVAVGAPAASFYPRVADVFGGTAVVPDHADVANAVGAAVGVVRVENHLTVTRPRAGRFEIHGTAGNADGPRSFATLDEAEAAARATLTDHVCKLAVSAGAEPDGLHLTDRWDATTAPVGGREVLVEATLSMIATGRPKTAFEVPT